MITINHVLRDGTRKNDVTGHIVRRSDAPGVYALAAKMRNRKENVKNGNV